ncbi:MAG: hypothetical protein VKP72_07680 [bacterium]|nr:hypothetical protein [bacterium]
MFNRSRLPLVLTVLVVTLLPILYAVVLLAREKDGVIAFASRERDGVAYLRPVRTLMETQPLQALHRMGVKDDLALGLSGARKRLMAAFEELDRCDRRHGSRFLTGLVVARVRADWGFIDRLDPRTAIAQSLTGLNTSLLALNAHIGDRSNLILDPDLDSYYLMDALVVKLPTAVDLLGHVMALAREQGVGTPMGDAARNQIVALSGLLRSNLEGVGNDYRVAFENQPSLARSLEPLRRESEARTQSVLALLESAAQSRQAERDVHARLMNPVLAAFRADFALYDATSPALDGLLVRRISRVERSKWQAAIAIGLLGLASVGVVVFLLLRMGAVERPAVTGT